MRNRTTAAATIETKYAEAVARLTLAESRHGTPRPRIALEFPRGTSFRVTAARAYALAAAVELASDAIRGAGWVVQVSSEDTVATVDLELVEGLAAEVKAGMEMLRAVLIKEAS